MNKIIALSLGLSIGFSAIAQEVTNNTQSPTDNTTTQTQSSSLTDQATSLMKQIVEKKKVTGNQKETATTSQLADEQPSSATAKEEINSAPPIKLPEPIKAAEIKAPEPSKIIEATNAKEPPKNDTPKVVKQSKPIVAKSVEPVKIEASKTAEAPKAKEPVKTEAPVVANSAINTKADVNCEPPAAKPVIKKKRYVKPKPKVVVKAKNIETVKEKSVLTDFSSFHIPSNAQVKDEDYHKFATPISYEDIEQIHSFNEKIFSLSLIDKRTNASLDEYYFNEGKKNVDILVLNHDLSNAHEHSIAYKTNSAVEVKDETLNNSCKIVLVKYQLKTEESEMGLNYFLNGGKSVDELPKDCLPKNIDSRETMFLTEDMVVVNIGFNQKSLSEEKIGMAVHFSSEGRDFFPNNLRMYALKTDFSEYYNLDPQKNTSKKTFFGANVNKSVSSGNYYILIGFEHNNKTNWIKTTANVK